MAHPDAFCGRMRFYLNMRIGKGQKKSAQQLFSGICLPLPRGMRIGEVPQAEGFGKHQRRHFAKFAEKPLCG